MRVFRRDEAKRVRGGLFCITLCQLASRILDPYGSLAKHLPENFIFANKIHTVFWQHSFFAIALFEEILVPVLGLE
jgi:hypothetical protein